jgi:hypothetical protein
MREKETKWANWTEYSGIKPDPASPQQNTHNTATLNTSTPHTHTHTTHSHTHSHNQNTHSFLTHARTLLVHQQQQPTTQPTLTLTNTHTHTHHDKQAPHDTSRTFIHSFFKKSDKPYQTDRHTSVAQRVMVRVHVCIMRVMCVRVRMRGRWYAAYKTECAMHMCGENEVCGVCECVNVQSVCMCVYVRVGA